ncbi:GAF and ANTAR domain-containing protein [Nocardioides aestuarii]|uniref:GAF and ANTAR domain-containing protein n=1 Tax=Nocardioides aestuarii TaxID=252231 RepID=UPI0031E2D519
MAGDLAAVLAEAARVLQSEQGERATMQRTLELAVALVPSCEEAGISVVVRGQFDSPAVSSEVVAAVDRLQAEYGEGPCIDAILEQRLVYGSDLAADARWRLWGPAVVSEFGIRSMLCFRLFTAEDVVGALNLYSSQPNAFDTVDRDHGVALAAHAAVAVVCAQHADQMRVALDSRTVTAQATGILMERHGLPADTAFDVLRRVSSQTNRKLRDVAQELVMSGHVSAGDRTLL